MQTKDAAHDRGNLRRHVKGGGTMAKTAAVCVEKDGDRRTKRLDQALDRAAHHDRSPVRFNDADSEALAVRTKALDVRRVGVGLLAESFSFGILSLERGRCAKAPSTCDVEIAAFFRPEPNG